MSGRIVMLMEQFLPNGLFEPSLPHESSQTALSLLGTARLKAEHSCDGHTFLHTGLLPLPKCSAHKYSSYWADSDPVTSPSATSFLHEAREGFKEVAGAKVTDKVKGIQGFNPKRMTEAQAEEECLKFNVQGNTCGGFTYKTDTVKYDREKDKYTYDIFLKKKKGMQQGDRDNWEADDDWVTEERE
eukprot:gnl/TRDRNA2_/TRDRNA2_41316_c0_seq1.p1 gnl/TRDRNA2_/TRDRNA2_41316_c0~~gnl/TRDRNA2_/TRDRNA2_41316_c0_seq1.p1  ORF type:complete len:186 (+),score=52.12 gnl/TRDRNA2_/TRDRNA2_41316_c0_seq1:94-651(+)